MKGIACAFEGRITRAAELKTASASGRQFITLSVVTGEGDKEQWLSVSAWRESDADLVPHLTVGVEVYVEGKIEMRHWHGAEGPRSGLAVSATLVQPLALIGRSKPKTPRAAKGGKAKVDHQAPIETKPFNDALPF